MKLTEQEVRDRITVYSPDYEYVCGFVDTNGYVTLKCKHCGNVVSRSMIGIRKHTGVRCSECQKEERNIKAKKHEEFLRFQRSLRKGTKHEQLQTKICVECGSLFFDTARSKFCSLQCLNKQMNRNKEIKRRAKLSDAMVDKDISLQRLYERDHGCCWICNGMCDFDDYNIVGNAFIAGNSYPSIDHVVALANGGKHSWSNVRLAHRICNSQKSDSENYLPGGFFEGKGAGDRGGDFCVPGAEKNGG